MVETPYYFGWASVAVFLILGVLFIVVNVEIPRIAEMLLFLRRHTLRPHRPYEKKLDTYECGEQAVGDARVRFNPRFYIIALIFVLFDVEIVFLYPWAVALNGFKQASGDPGVLPLGIVFADMAVFVTVLLVGFAYLWRYGYLEWNKTLQGPRTEVS